MKRILFFTFSMALSFSAFSQYFQATITNPTLNQVAVKIKPTANITGQISYIQFTLRYPIATTPAFKIDIATNTAEFAGMKVDTLPYTSDGTYNYINFVHNTGSAPSTGDKAFVSGTEYTICTLAFIGNPDVAPLLELVSDQNGSTAFGVVDGTGNLLTPTGDELYGPGFQNNGGVRTVPLTDVPVPVKFASFSVIKKDGNAQIKWAVENESSITDRYEVLRSSNGRDFVKVATVLPKNNGLTANTYELTENNVAAIPSAAGAVYYRIKQIDKDGAFIFTEIRNLRIDGKEFGVSAYPNPVKNSTKLTIDLEQAAEVVISLTNTAGQQLGSIQFRGVKGTNFKDVDLSKYASGNYSLKVQAGKEIKTISVAKIN
ncbi:MAG: T9SS type A sorting domain-containing protein [Ferruginibacter sp.]